MANYYLGDNGALVSAKKKKKKQGTNYNLRDDGTLYVNKEEQESALKQRNDEIAPVKKQSSGYLQKSSYFDDGYQFGDVVKTIGATLGDVGENIAKGSSGWLERVWDGMIQAGTQQAKSDIDKSKQQLIMHNALMGKDTEGVSEKFDATKEELQKETAEYVAKNIIQEDKIDFGLDEKSVLGEESDALVQSATDVVIREGIKRIPYVGIPLAYATTGLSVIGGEAENAYNNGATFDEAFASGLVSASGEMGTEALFGGIKIGGKTLTEGAVSKLSSVFSKKALQTFAKWGVNTVGEGVEEYLSGWASALGQKMTYLDEKELNEIYTSEDKWDNFVAGALLGGLFEGVNWASAKKGGMDYVTGLTNNERKVADKVYKDKVAEQEQKKGKKLTVNEKTKIFDSVIEDMEHGQISTDTIEEVLGGDTYNQYKTAKGQRESLVNKKAELQKELAELENKSNTIGNAKRYDAIEGDIKDIDAQIKNLDKYPVISNLKSQLDAEVSEQIKDSRLVESYNEIARKKEAFKVDLNQYTGKRREAVERAVKSGVLNNTYRSHQLVDILSKIEEQKGIKFDYANNERLKETGLAVEGKTVNGFMNKSTDAVTLNVQSSKAWQSTVGHEITHILEGTEAYGELQSALFAYAKSKGELDSRKANLTELYKDLDADIDAELTADLVGDYLFTDSSFIKNLTGNRNLFQKVYDEIKYLCKVATGKELTEIEKVRQEFDKAWKELSIEGINENEATDAEIDDVKYSISVEDKDTLDFLNEQVSRGEYNAETNPNGGYYVTYKSMSYWGTDENGNAILRSPMAEYVDGELSNAYIIPKDKNKLNWYKATETLDENTGLPSGLMVKVKKEGNKSFTYLPAAENQDLIKEDWSNLYFNLEKKVLKNGRWVKSDVPARYNPYEHSSNSMLNDQFSAAYLRDNLVTVKMYVPISEDNGAFRAKWSKDPTGWADWKTGTVAGKINKQKDLQRKVYLSRYAAPVEIVPDSEVAQAYKEYLDGTDVTIPDNVVSPNLLNELKKAGVPITESGKVKNKGNVEYDKATQSYSPIKYSISSWSESDYVTERQSAAEDMAKALGVTTEKASKYIDDVNSIAKLIADDKTRLAYEPSPNRSAFVSNAEYGGSIDFSTICKKRRLFTGTFEAIQNALPNTALTAEEVLEIRKMMKDKGYEVSCGLCYVEGSRANMGQYTKQFIERYKATNPEYVPNMAEMNTATGQEKIRKEHPEVYEAYEYFMNHYGRLSPTDKALFASQQKPKMYQMATEYKGEVLDNFGKQKGSVEAKNKNGGLRLQSFSDFEIIHLIDSMQVIMDMSRVGLAGQAYTKVPDFAWALGDTGLKINLSLIAKGVDENGRLILDDVEGMKEADAMALRDRYSDNVGTILVAFNDEQLKAAMADERIDYIIPYHRSQWKTDQYEAMGLPENTKDYTNLQNESYIEPVYNKNGKKQRPNNYMPNTYWDFSKSGKENAEKYLQMCAENNRKPKFSHLLVDNQDGSYSLQPDGSTDGYWKTLIDFKMYNNDGIGVPQNPVTPDFNMEEAQRMLNEYTGGHAKFPVAQDIVDEFVSKHPDNIAPTDVKYSLSADSQKNDADYLKAVESGDTETAQRMVDEAAKKAGYTRTLYHGTASKFNVFGFGRAGIFTTDNYDMAKTYGDNVISLYGKEGANVLTIDAQESPHYAIRVSKDVLDFSEYPLIGKKETYSTNDISLIAFREGYDVVVINNVYDNYHSASGNTENGLGTDVVYKDSNQVKSSEAITYDDNGNVIPLSERFNEKNEDIRFSLSKQGEQPSSIGTPLKDLYYEGIAPVKETAPTRESIPKADNVAPTVENATVDAPAIPKSTQLVDGTRGDNLLNESLDNYPIETVEQRVAENIRAIEGNLADNRDLRKEAEDNYNSQIAELQERYKSKKNKNTKVANQILQSISRLERLKASTDAKFAKQISDLEARVEKMKDPKYIRAKYKQEKMQEHAKWAADLLGDTSTWKDKKIGLQYATNTERRNLRDIVRDENGNIDIERADMIDDALNGRYNREEAAKKRELSQVRGKYADLKITKAEDAYIQMLGELRHNPDTTLTQKAVDEYYEKHKNKIDAKKVDKVIDLARQDYDNFLNRVNEKLREQGMKEIPHRQGYFPHFTEPKQNFIQKLFNWKVQDNEIPTSIAGLTETFKPTKSWQSFDKTRHSDTTDYSFAKGFDNYSQGVLDWIYHLDTLQKRRAVENHIRFTHSDEGIKARIKEVYANNEMDANEAQAQIEHILAEAKNPLNNFVQDFTTHTNILAGKKNSLDRTVEQWSNRHIYSVMTNIQNRMSANMVLANVRSALTNFIPITQSWAQVSPVRSLQATKETIANAIKDDGMINKSTFLTNRLREADNLYKTNWDKVMDKAGIMFEIVDSFSSQVIWRSKYHQNLANGMTESQAIQNADQFAENVMAGRSKGNEPTLFNAKNPFVKAFTMFQLEVNNQYGYLFKDVPNDLKTETEHWKFNLAKGYATAFIGAHIYNALLEQVAGSGAALDPIDIIKDLLKDLGLWGDDEEEEPAKVVTNLIENVGGELPFVGGTLFGGGRIPISSAMPYGDNGLASGIGDFVTDVTEGNWQNVGKEMMNPLLNIVSPVGGGQLKKTMQGLKMFNTDEEHPVTGSYTDSGSLRFPVEDTLGNRIQAGIFGQYASENAREYFDNDYAPLKEKQIQEYMDVDMPIKDYWEYREGLKGLKTTEEKFDYIDSLDLPLSKKNILANNVTDRKEDVDLENYDDFSSLEEFDYATKNPEKYAVAKAVGGYSAYKSYSDELYDIKADKDENGKSISGSRKEKVIDYINNLNADYYEKIILFKSEYPADDTYNAEIVNYINNREDLTYEERVAIFTELDFTVQNGSVYWD